jgi:hypothetical protein
MLREAKVIDDFLTQYHRWSIVVWRLANSICETYSSGSSMLMLVMIEYRHRHKDSQW